MRHLQLLFVLTLWAGICFLACVGWLTPDTSSHSSETSHASR